MFGKALAFELRYQLRRPSFYICLAAVGLIIFLMMTGFGQRAGSAQALIRLNTPTMIARLLVGVGILTLLIPIVLFGRAAIRDAETGMEELVRATPAALPTLLLARFAATFLATALIYLVMAPAAELALRMPWVDEQIAAPFQPVAYAQAYAVLVLPNLLFVGAAVFALVAWTGSMMPGYALLVALLTLVFGINLTGLNNTPVLAPLLDPFGATALTRLTRYWSSVQQSRNALPFEGVLLWNRLIWLGVSLLLLAGTALLLPRSVRGSRPRIVDAPLLDVGGAATRIPAIAPGGATAMRQLLTRMRYEAGVLLWSWTFPLMLALLGGLCFVVLKYPDSTGTLPFVPATAIIAPRITEIAVLGGLVMIVLLAGEAMWRERGRQVAEIVDVTPVASGVLLGGKLAALTLVSAIYLLVALSSAVGYQLWRGAAGDIDPGVYAVSMLLGAAIPLLMTAVLAMLAHVLAPNKYAGHLAVLGLLAASATAFVFGVEDGLIQFGSIPQVPLSVMNGTGHYIQPALWFTAYWGGVTVLMAVAARLLWPRGARASLLVRLRDLPAHATRGAIAVAAVALAVSAVAGGVIFWNTHVLHPFYTDKDVERLRAEYERAGAGELGKPQPRVAEIELALDLDPGKRVLAARGSYGLVNRSGRPIDSVRVQFNDDLKVGELTLETGKLASHAPAFNDYVFAVDPPLAPEASLRLSFSGVFSNAGFQHGEQPTPINRNGTILYNSHFAPWIGVMPRMFLTDAVRRRKLGLPPLTEAEEQGMVDEERNFLAHDSDFVRIGLTVSTAPGQTAVGPGTLKRQWEEGGRHYFRYETDTGVMNFWTVLSARYETSRAAWGDVELAVHHDARQGANAPRMLAAMQASLTYYTETFGPFPHRQLRIAEFPYGAMAQSFPATISYAEAIGFMIDGQVDAIDIVSFITAHEVAHQWWGHQAVPADLPGAQMLSETLAEYSALMVMERLYGPDRIRAYLKSDLDQYLSQRAGDVEQPLASVRMHQGHIAYKKGALAMIALRDAIGQEAMDRALRRYLDTYRNATTPYPTAEDLLGILREEAGEQHQELISDLFERITFWELSTHQALVSPTEDGKWRVRLTVGGRKLHADENGAEESAELDDMIDIGLFAADPASPGFQASDVILIEKRRLSRPAAGVDFITDRKPLFAGINPYLKLIEKDPADNVIPVSE